MTEEHAWSSPRNENSRLPCTGRGEKEVSVNGVGGGGVGVVSESEPSTNWTDRVQILPIEMVG